MENIVVIGGTGMLMEATKWLDKHSTNTIIFGRNIDKPWLKDRSNEDGFDFHFLDYRDTQKVRYCIRKTIEEIGPIDLVLAWIHSSASKALIALFEEINQKKEWRLFHVKGSSNNKSLIEGEISVPEKCLYRSIHLGFIIEPNSSRWLTHEEISNGVITAIKQDNKRTIIGTLSPWEKRP